MSECPKCRSELVRRTGKFGAFMCCPKSYKGNNHGTWAVGANVSQGGLDIDDAAREAYADYTDDTDGWGSGSPWESHGVANVKNAVFFDQQPGAPLNMRTVMMGPWDDDFRPY